MTRFFCREYLENNEIRIEKINGLDHILLVLLSIPLRSCRIILHSYLFAGQKRMY